MPKVSVIIPCYNQGHFIDEAVDSVLVQTFQDFEIIIINDGSTDGFTVEKLKNYNKPKTKVLHTLNQGLSEARNVGANNSSGYLLCFLDSDNKLSSDYLEYVSREFVFDNQVAVVYTDAYYFGDRQGEWKQGNLVFPDMLLRNQIDACSLVRKKLWEDIGGFNRNMKYGWEDWDFWLNAYEKKAIFKHVNKSLFYYRIVQNSLIYNIEKEKSKRVYLEQQLISNHIELYKKYFPDPIRILREFDWMEEQFKNFEEVKKQIYGSLSYRLGSSLLMPLKSLAKVLKRWS